jgi:SAM-dependent methyltransferase
MISTKEALEAERLDPIGADHFGDDDVEGDPAAYDRRGTFWLPLLDELKPENVLEVGSGAGGNVQWIVQRVTPSQVVGVDVDARASRLLEARVPGARTMYAPASDLPFADRSVDLVFTTGVLVHQPEETLVRMMSEMVRVSRRHVLCGASEGSERVAPPARGRRGAHRCDFGRLCEELFPYELAPVRQGVLDEQDGWDRTTWWLFARG